MSAIVSQYIFPKNANAISLKNKRQVYNFISAMKKAPGADEKELDALLEDPRIDDIPEQVLHVEQTHEFVRVSGSTFLIASALERIGFEAVENRSGPYQLNLDCLTPEKEGPWVRENLEALCALSGWLLM